MERDARRGIYGTILLLYGADSVQRLDDYLKLLVIIDNSDGEI